MVIVLLGVYLVIGYTTFRVWVRLCPPQNGAHGNDCVPWDLRGDGWYIPSWMNKTSYYTTLNVEWGRGQSIPTVFWESLLGWPLLLVIGSIAGMSNGMVYLVKVANKAVSNTIVRHVIPPPPPAPVPAISEEMVAANLEVEELLAQEN